jgi:DNA polymerase
MNNIDLNKIQDVASTCTLCELCKGRNKPVFAKGNQHSKFMICGMVPGPEENKVGTPFIGRAGKLLDIILERIDLTLNDVYITNVVKCALQPGIPLTQPWIDSCSVYLLAQVSIIRPDVIVTLGADSTNALLGFPLDTKIGKLRGNPQVYFNTHVIPTYHPSYLLRGGGEQHKFFNKVVEDFELAQLILGDKNEQRRMDR